MRQRWTESLILVLLDFNSSVWMMLPAPSTVSIESVDMTHMLRWRPLQVPCNTSVLYSVQFQGEFELTVLNGRWLDAPECQLTPQTHCDLTFDLGSDSDYNLRVRAQCGSQVSAWAPLSRPFNRRDTVLAAAPRVSVSAVGNTLQVSFDKLPPTAVVRVTMWKRGEELQATVYLVPAERAELHVAALQEGAEYCVRAQTLLGSQLQSRNSNDHCVSITGADAAWKRPTTVAVAVIIVAGVLFAVFWSVVHCRPDVCRIHFHKQPLPEYLQTGWDIENPMSLQEVEICERVDMMQSAACGPQGPESESVLSSHLAVDVVELYHPQRPQETSGHTCDL